MRIISGCRRGHKLIEFEGDSIRPTTDRVKESLFNLIQEFVAGARVLDLFGGSGALAFEAVSRGAECAVCVDKSAASVDIIKRNRAELRFEALVQTVNADAIDFLKGAQSEFDIILMDPPYNKGLTEPALRLIVSRGLLAERGIIAVESDSGDAPEPVDGLHILKQRRYGRTYITVFSR